MDYEKLDMEGRLLVLPPKHRKEETEFKKLVKCAKCPLSGYKSSNMCRVWGNQYCTDRTQVIQTLNDEMLEDYPE
jgi:hypothetical protein